MNTIETALVTALSSDNTLTALLSASDAIYNGPVPRGVSLPWIQISLASGMEDTTSPRDLRNLIYNIKAVANTITQADAIAERIHVLLHRQQLTMDTWHNFWMARDTIIRYTEPRPNGRFVAHVGGSYRIRLAKEN